MITLANVKVVNVLAVNILSFIRSQVKRAKIIFPTPKPISFVVHREPETSTVLLTAYQNERPTGNENTKVDNTGRADHHSQTNCEFSWNQARILAATKNNIPVATLMLTYTDRKSIQFVNCHKPSYHEVLQLQYRGFGEKIFIFFGLFVVVVYRRVKLYTNSSLYRIINPQ